ncbi:MAG: thioredoxin-disulfide reductase [Dehalococcoidia bacterium]|nr:thioredoxin-disulfide reductase [Dehalococcoidia bacterium]
MEYSYQVIIVGGGPAGLAAGLYTARARLNALLIEKLMPGGQLVNAELIENYPGFPEGISGSDLGSLMEQQARKYGLEILMDEVSGVEVKGDLKIVKTAESTYTGRTLIIASGASHSRLGVPGEDELSGRGVSYCATCDGALFKDASVAVIGGGDTALSDALLLSRFASRVTIVHRRDKLRASKILQERAYDDPRIEFLLNSVVEAVEGNNRVEQLQVRNVRTGERSILAVDGVFIAVGSKPGTGYLAGLLALSEDGSIAVNANMETSVPGIFAAGDIRSESCHQVAAAVGDGVCAAMAAQKYLIAV